MLPELTPVNVEIIKTYVHMTTFFLLNFLFKNIKQPHNAYSFSKHEKGYYQIHIFWRYIKVFTDIKQNRAPNIIKNEKEIKER